MTNNMIDPNDGGTVVLRGIKVDVNSDVGAAFVIDICRHLDDLLSAEALRTKYGLLDDNAWAGLAENEPLQRAIAAAKTRRIHDGSAARERAQHAFLAGPNILNGIMNDSSAPSRSRIESIRELRGRADRYPEERARSVRHQHQFRHCKSPPQHRIETDRAGNADNRSGTQGRRI
jgi:hypothetical protein